MLTVATFVLGLTVVNLWTFDNSIPKGVPTSAPKSALPEKLERTEDKDILPVLMLKMEELKINNVELGSSFSTIIEKLGKPLQKKKTGSFPCGDSAMLTLDYAGLIIRLDGDESGQNFRTASMEVTSPKWSVSGINVGADKREVKDRFKNYLFNEIKESELDVLSYGNLDGYIGFYFRNDKLVKISWEYNFC
jgi:hypothetical protein